MTAALKQYDVSAQVNLFVQVTVSAVSLEAAAALAKDLKPTDFYRSKGEVIDHSLAIIGVSDRNLPKMDIE